MSRAAGGTICGQDGYSGTGSHFEGVMTLSVAVSCGELGVLKFGGRESQKVRAIQNYSLCE
jgi:hypothetical protein